MKKRLISLAVAAGLATAGTLVAASGPAQAQRAEWYCVGGDLWIYEGGALVVIFRGDSDCA